MALREIQIQNDFRPRKPEATYEEAIDRMDESWTRFYEAMNFPIRDLLAGRRWLTRFKDSSQLEVMLHQVLFFMDEQRENWTRTRHKYLSIEKCFGRTLFNAILTVRRNLVWDVKVKPPVDRITFHRLMPCYGFEPFQSTWTKRQKNTVRRYVNVINFYYSTFNKCNQNTMRAMIDANDRLPNM